MNNFSLDNFKHIHFVGIGGISMHLLAIYCKQCGKVVSGSDIKQSKYTNICESEGIKMCIGHKRKNLLGADLTVYSSAVRQDNVELNEAILRRVKVISRAELLAEICKKFKYVIGVAGTHGKTTTCAMMYHILKTWGKKVSCHIGADVEGARLNVGDDYLVLECCEYKRSFLSLYYNIAVVLNIDNDHLDCYGNMYNLRNAFKTFLKRADTRFVLDNKSTDCIKAKANHIKQAVILGNNKFEINGKKFVLDGVYGEYNINNATVAVEVCASLGVSYTKMYKALKSFKSAGRRCQVLGRVKDFDVITDYAHHPTEIKALYNGLQAKYDKVYMVFQPHTYSRTKLLLRDFVKVFSCVENLFIYKEYPARENKSQGYSAKQLCEFLNISAYIKNFHTLKKVFNDIEGGGCVAFVGAGDINTIAEKFVKTFEK